VPVAIYDAKPQPVETPNASQNTDRTPAIKPPWQQWLELIVP
jgi:hypothetical protein